MAACCQCGRPLVALAAVSGHGPAGPWCEECTDAVDELEVLVDLLTVDVSAPA